jgi:hypothetical protein
VRLDRSACEDGRPEFIGISLNKVCTRHTGLIAVGCEITSNHAKIQESPRFFCSLFAKDYKIENPE